MLRYVPLAKLPPESRTRFLSQAEQIFFQTSTVQVFESNALREAFLQRWFGNYVKSQPEAFFFALDDTDRVIAYLAGCIDSFAPDTSPIRGAISFYTSTFCAALRSYPSHFHINVTPTQQRRGVGRELIAQFVRLCRQSRSSGIHVVTGAASPAVKFYEACGFKRHAMPKEANSDLAVFVHALC